LPGAPEPRPPSASTLSTAAPVRHSNRGKLIAGIAVSLVGTGGFVAGAALAGLAHAANAQIDQPVPGATYDPAVLERRDLYQPVGVTFLVVGSAAMATGALIAILAKTRPQ